MLTGLPARPVSLERRSTGFPAERHMTDTTHSAAIPSTTPAEPTARTKPPARPLTLSRWAILVYLPHVLFGGVGAVVAARAGATTMTDSLWNIVILAAMSTILAYLLAMIAFYIGRRSSIAGNTAFALIMALLSVGQFGTAFTASRSNDRVATADLARGIEDLRRSRREAVSNPEFGSNPQGEVREEVKRVDSLIAMLEKAESSSSGENAAVTRCMRIRLREMAELDVKFFRELNAALEHTNGSPQMSMSKDQLDRCTESLLAARGLCDEAIAKYGTLRSGAVEELVAAGIPEARAREIIRTTYRDEAVDRSRRLREARRDLVDVLMDQTEILKSEWGFWGNDIATLDVSFSEPNAADAWNSTMVRFAEVAEREQLLIRQLAGLPADPAAPEKKSDAEVRMTAEAPVRW